MAEVAPARRQARTTWRVLAVLSVVTGSMVGAAAIVAGRSIRLGLPSLDRMIDACRSLLPQLGVGPGLVLFVAGLGLCIATRAARAVWAEARRSRRVGVATSRGEPAVLAGQEVWVIAEDRPMAFTAGVRRPRIYVSSGTLGCLGPAELAAVVRHEAHHRARRDPLRAAAARVAVDALFFVPGLKKLAFHHGEAVELAADEAAVATAGTAAVASALLAVGALSALSGDEGSVGLGSGGVGIAPERVDHLAGRGLPRLPIAVVVAATFGTAILGVIGLEGVEAARLAPVNVVLAAAQVCSMAFVGLALVVAAQARRIRRAVSPSQ